MSRTETKINPWVLGAIGAAHVSVTALTWRDLRRRPAGQVRGKKAVWRVLSAANTSGSAMYWLFGRRPSRSAEASGVA
jgi:hypothetical protein